MQPSVLNQYSRALMKPIIAFTKFARANLFNLFLVVLSQVDHDSPVKFYTSDLLWNIKNIKEITSRAYVHNPSLLNEI